MSNIHPLNNRPGPVSGPIFDTLVNLLSGLGTAKDKTTQTRFTMSILDRSQLLFAYRGDWIARKIIDAPAQDSTREWRAWQADKKDITDLEKVEKSLRLQLKVKQAMQRARLFGGAALVMGVDQGSADQELRVDKVRADQLKYVHVLNKDVIVPDRLILDVNSEFYGEPESYTVNSADSGIVRIHPSRVIRFLGNEIPDINVAPDGWGDSVLQTIYDAVIQAGQTTANVASIVHEAKVDVVKIPNMMEQIGTAEYRAQLLQRFTLANSMKSLVNTLILDKEEEWERITSSFAGLPDLIHAYLLIASGAADIPATRMLGQSAKGLNATGQEDTRNYYDRLSSDQRNDVTPRLDRLDEVMIRSVFGEKPEEITYAWNSLWQLSETEAAEVASKKATVYTADVNAGLIPPEVLREGRENQLIEDEVYPGLEQAIDTYGQQNLDEYNQAVVAQMGARAALTAPDNPNDPNAANKKASAAKAEIARRKALPPPRPPAARSQDRRTHLLDWNPSSDGWLRSEFTQDATTPRSLYVRRDVLNGEEILKHFEDQGVDTSDYDAADLHVTILYSRQPVDWIKMGESYHVQPGGADDLPEGVDMRINAGGPRVMEAYGVPPDTLVMCFASSALCYRHQHMIYQGASEDYEDFNPHLSVARWDGTDPRTLDPWIGEILLGPEIFEPVKQGGTEGETLDAYDPSEPRAPAGSGQGGQWTSEGSWAGRLHESMRDNAGFDAVVAELKSSKVTQPQMYKIATEFFTIEWGHDPGFARSKSKGYLLKEIVDWQAVDARQRARLASHARQDAGDYDPSEERDDHGKWTKSGKEFGAFGSKTVPDVGRDVPVDNPIHSRQSEYMVNALTDKGKDAFAGAPIADVSVRNLTSWQNVVYKTENFRPLSEGYAPIDVVRHQGRDVVVGGNHRAAMAFAGGMETVRAHYLNLDDPKNAKLLKLKYRSTQDYDPSEPRAAAGSAEGGQWTLSGTRAARLDKVLAEKRARAEGDISARLKRTREAAVAKSKRMAAAAAQKTVEFLKDNENKAEGLGMLASAFSGQLTGADIAVREMVHEMVSSFAKQMDAHTAAARGALRAALNKAIDIRRGLTGDADQQGTDDVLAALLALLAELDSQGDGEAQDWRVDVADYRPDQLRGKGGKWAKESGGGRGGKSGRGKGVAKTAAGAKGAGTRAKGAKTGAKAAEKRRAQFEQNANFIRRLNDAGNDRKKFEAVMKDLEAAKLSKDQLLTVLKDYRLTASMLYSARMSRPALLERFRADFTHMRRFLNKIGVDMALDEYVEMMGDYSPDQPREPAGTGRGGQFSTIVGGDFSSHARAAGLDVRLLKSKRLASGRASEVDLSTKAGTGLIKPMSVEVAQEFKVGSKWRRNPDQAGDYAAGIGLMLARKFPSLARFAEQFWYDAAANMTPKEYAYAKSYFATRDGAFSEGYRAAFSPNGKAFGLNKTRTEAVFGRSVGQLRVGVDSAIKGSGGSSSAREGLFSRMGNRLARMIGA